jgi:hypothetical protein
MPLSTNVTNLATAVATELKKTRVLVNGNAADLSALTTSAKTSLVAAVNELADAQAGSSGIDDGATGTTTTWSSSKINGEISGAVSDLVAGAPTALDTLNELATALQTNDSEIGTILTGLDNRVRVDAAQTFDSTQQTTARTNIGAASAASVTTLTTNVGDTSADFVATFTAGLA